ncbi:hypothetical protein HMPREF6123_0739 [Oribacterium sinus F0268]|uniref:Peptidase U32 collagenase domain-containing protein n=1 Tax=Oribacterium sinus F0268 TaxID=585501 RepID=C2KW70_9FIRM|nr:hypothetical protein HMPREF6123_0739 [Oribacterium sinus F0268]
MGEIRVSIERGEQLKAVLQFPFIKGIYLDEGAFSEEELLKYRGEIQNSGKWAGLRFRRIQRREDRGRSPKDWMEEAKNEEGFRHFLLRALDQVAMLQDFPDRKFSTCFDYTLYSYNQAAMEVWESLGAKEMCFPIEFRFQEDMAFSEWARSRRISTELLCYGHLPMMVSANCIEKTRNGCTRGNNVVSLQDRQNKSMPVRLYCKYCYNQIYNSDVLSLIGLEKEVERLGASSFRFDFTVESEKEILELFQGKPLKQFTRGHFHKGIE